MENQLQLCQVSQCEGDLFLSILLCLCFSKGVLKRKEQQHKNFLDRKIVMKKKKKKKKKKGKKRRKYREENGR